jgi:hypothetical protein
METGKLTIIRAKYFNDKMSGKGFNIFIDGKDVGKVPFDEAKSFELSEGEHKIYAKVNWCISKIIIVNIKPNETKEIELGLTNPVTRPRFIITIIFAILWLGSLIIGKAFHIEWLREMGFVSLYAFILYDIIILRKKSGVYGMTFGRKNYLYLKELGNQDS